MQLCPSQKQLSDYVLGKLAHDASDSVTDHLKVCESCLSRVDEVDELADSMVRQLRNPEPDDQFMLEPQCTQMFTEARQTVRELDPELFKLREYRITKKLGKGGMGTVYRAIHTKLDRRVAVKLLPPERMQNADAVSRFEREMKAIGKLDHPNIVRAHDAGESDGKHYLVMELVDGIDLSTLVKQVGEISVSDACEIIRQAANGLHHAHEHELVHRDIKPSNLMLTVAGKVKILDLGLARLHDTLPDDYELTSTGQIMGTLDYMAPEQLGDSHEVDARADIYSLGATLYKLLTGKAPYADTRYNSPQKKLMAIATKPVTPVSKFRDDIPQELVTVLDRMLAKNPDERYSSASDVAVAVSDLIEKVDLKALVVALEVESPTPDEQSGDRETTVDPVAYTDTQQSVLITVPPAPLSARLRRRSHPPVWLIGIAACLFIVPVTLIIVYATSGNATFVVEVHDKDGEAVLKENGLVIRDRKTGREWTIRNPGESTLPSGAYFVVTDDSGLEVNTDEFKLIRGGQQIVRVWVKARNIDDESKVVNNRDDLKTASPQLKQELEQLRTKVAAAEELSIDNTELLQLKRQIAEFHRKCSGTPQSIEAIQLLARLPSPFDKYDGTQVSKTDPPLASDVPLVAVMDADYRFKHWSAINDIACSPDEKMLATASKDGTAKLWNVDTGGLLRTLLGHKYPVYHVAISPDGTNVATSSLEGELLKWDIKTGELLFSVRLSQLGDIEFSPDGAVIGVVHNSALELRDVLSGEEVSRIELTKTRLPGALSHVTFNPVNSTAAVFLNKMIYVVDIAKRKKLFEVERNRALYLAYSHDGKELFAQGRVIDATSGREIRKVTVSGNYFGVIPSNDTFVFRQSDGRLSLVDRERKRTPVILNTVVRSYGPATALLLKKRSCLATCSVYENTVRLWNVENGGEQSSPRGEMRLSSVAFSPDGTRLARSLNNHLVVRDLISESKIHRFELASPESWSNVTWSPDDTYLLGSVGGDAGKCEVKMLDIRRRRSTNAQLPNSNYQSNTYPALFNPSGTLLAIAEYDGVSVWDTATRKQQWKNKNSFPEDPACSVAFSPDGNILAVGTLHTRLLFFHADSGKQIGPLKGHASGAGAVRALAFDPDGLLLISGSSNGQVILWDVPRQKKVVVLEDVDGIQCRSLSVSPDGTLLATGHDDGTLVLWDIKRAELLHTYQLGPFGGRVNNVVFTPEGRYLATANGDGSIYILRVRDKPLKSS